MKEWKFIKKNYERLLKLANNFQHMTTYNFLVIVFKYGLQPYMCIITLGMKRKTLHQHKEVVLVCEKGIYEVETISNVLVSHIGKIILA
jgi:hypothetical protein